MSASPDIKPCNYFLRNGKGTQVNACTFHINITPKGLPTCLHRDSWALAMTDCASYKPQGSHVSHEGSIPAKNKYHMSPELQSFEDEERKNSPSNWLRDVKIQKNELLQTSDGDTLEQQGMFES